MAAFMGYSYTYGYAVTCFAAKFISAELFSNMADAEELSIPKQMTTLYA
jgi:hypothetical protein